MSIHSTTKLRPETILKLWLYTKQEGRFSAYGLPDKQPKPAALPMPYLWEVNSRPESDHRPYNAGSAEQSLLAPVELSDLAGDEYPEGWESVGEAYWLYEF